MKLLEINNTSLLAGVEGLKDSIKECRTLGMSIREVSVALTADVEATELRKKASAILGVSEEGLVDLSPERTLSHLTDQYVEAVCNTIVKFTKVYATQAENIAIIQDTLASVGDVTEEQFASAVTTAPDFIWLGDMAETFKDEVNLISIVEAGINGCINSASDHGAFTSIFDELDTIGITCSNSDVKCDADFINEGTFASAMYKSKEDLDKGAKHATSLLKVGESLQQLIDGEINNAFEAAIHMGNDKPMFKQSESIATMLDTMKVVLELSLEVPYKLAMAVAKAKLS